MAYVLRRAAFLGGIMYKRGDLVPEGAKPPSTAVKVDEKAPPKESLPKKSLKEADIEKVKDA